MAVSPLILGMRPTRYVALLALVISLLILVTACGGGGGGGY
jgi:hypothetical protein